MIIKRIFIPLAIVALTACGGSGADNPAPTDGGADNPPSIDGGTDNPPSTDGGAVNPPSTDGGADNPSSTDGGAVNPPSTDGGVENPPSTDVEKPVEGYNPNLAKQTLTPEQLVNVDEIAANTTVTVKKDVILTAADKDLIIKGDLIIK